MKNIILISFITCITMSSSFAHFIEGTLVLKGSLKDKVRVKNITTTCRVKVDDVKNLMLEDSYGNPAYKVKLDISLSGRDFSKGVSVKFDRELWVTNLFSNGEKTEVKDLDYASEDGVKMRITSSGRMKYVQFPSPYKIIKCLF